MKTDEEVIDIVKKINFKLWDIDAKKFTVLEVLALSPADFRKSICEIDGKEFIIVPQLFR